MSQLEGTTVAADMIVSDCAMSGRQLYRDRAALIGDNVSWTYGELADRVERLAGVLVGLGARADDRIALLSYNSPAVIAVLLAAARIGAVVVPLKFPAGRTRSRRPAGHVGAGHARIHR